MTEKRRMMYGEKSTERVDRSKTKSRQNAWETGGGNSLRNVVNAVRRPTTRWSRGRGERGRSQSFPGQQGIKKKKKDLLTRKESRLKTQLLKKNQKVTRGLNGPAVICNLAFLTGNMIIKHVVPFPLAEHFGINNPQELFSLRTTPPSA